ncbi:MAG: DedA family protein [Parcubacteria group bacterium]|nr:DedA family protein [Parcubacteria group bacterium]
MDVLLATIASFITGIISSAGYLGIGFLMTIESCFIPFPSEVVILPAAYLAQQGEMNIFLVVIVGIVGSLLGASINYFLAYTLGRKVIYSLVDCRFFKFLFINKEKIIKAENYFLKYGNLSTFTGRLVPGVRQLISIPAGFSRMSFKSFILYTFLGSGVWVTILAVLGYSFGSNQELVSKYSEQVSLLFVVFALILIVLIIKKKKNEQ